MSRNRYVGDYRIVESIDGRGRVVSGYEYIGRPWAFERDEATVRAARRVVAISCAVGWAAWLAALLPVSSATRTLYVALPFIFAALPLGLNTALCWRLFRQKPPFEHRHADQLHNRGPACSFFTALLCTLALIGEGVNALRGAALSAGDAVFIAGAALLMACGIACHRQWKRLRCREMAE